MIARMTDGRVTGRNTVSAPGWGHSRHDDSVSIKLDPSAPDGLLVNSFSDTNALEFKNDLLRKLGVARNEGRERIVRRHVASKAEDLGDLIDVAARIWGETKPIPGTLGERYLTQYRKLKWADDLHECLRFHADLKLDGVVRPAVVALFRDVRTGAARGIQRIYIDRDSAKISRRMLGPTAGAAVMLDPFEDVEYGITIAEGVETAIAARQIGFRPTWALGSAGAIAAFAVLAGVDCVTICRETDDSGANFRAAEACKNRWTSAGREALLVTTAAGDLNDLVIGVARP
jgi:hypothetical protein